MFEMVDADLLARSMEWAAETPECRNEIYNITNGDVGSWEDLWPVIADALGMRPGPPEPMRLGLEMPKRASEWAAIVKKYNLVAPSDPVAFAGESFHFVDAIMAYGATTLVTTPMLVSTIKARQAGFHDCIDTQDMLRKWFRRYQSLRLLPPVDSQPSSS